MAFAIDGSLRMTIGKVKTTNSKKSNKNNKNKKKNK